MTIAILAHDSRKELALQFCTAYSAILLPENPLTLIIAKPVAISAINVIIGANSLLFRAEVWYFI